MLESQRLVLREYGKQDIPTVWEYWNDPDVKRCLMRDVPFPIRKEDEKKWYQELGEKGYRYNFAIERKQDRKYIGGCAILDLSWSNRYGTIAIFLGRDYWSKGYGSEAVKILSRFMFKEMALNRVELVVLAFNRRAIRAYEKAGFVLEGISRDRVFRDGKYCNQYYMSILSNEFSL
ncbi:MAG TPA: N-acetyltransferase [Kosmotogaceae bacterium]|nr:N-acetyltransferase [Kosmotogaceae bacterium]